MTPADRIRAAVSAVWDASQVPPTADDLAAAVCEALAEYVVLPKYGYADWAMAHVIHGEITTIAADLRGGAR